MTLRSLHLAIFFLLATACSAHAQKPEALLVGKWNFVSLTKVEDGVETNPKPPPGESTLQYAADGTWTLTIPNGLVKGTYRWIDPSHAEHKTVESNNPKQVGYVSVKEMKVTADKLILVTTNTREDMEKFSPAPAGKPYPNVSIVTSTFTRAR